MRYLERRNRGAERGQKRAKVVRVVVNMIPVAPSGGHMDGPQSHIMWNRQVACFIFEHRGLFGDQAIPAKDADKGGPVRFGLKIGVLHAVGFKGLEQCFADGGWLSLTHGTQRLVKRESSS